MCGSQSLFLWKRTCNKENEYPKNFKNAVTILVFMEKNLQFYEGEDIFVTLAKSQSLFLWKRTCNLNYHIIPSKGNLVTILVFMEKNLQYREMSTEKCGERVTILVFMEKNLQ